MSNIIFQENISQSKPYSYLAPVLPNRPCYLYGWGLSEFISIDRIKPVTKAGNQCLQIQVFPGDTPTDEGPYQPTERNELLNMFQPSVNTPNTIVDDVDGITGSWNIAFSLYMESTWQDPTFNAAHPYPWCIPLQLHCPNTFGKSPALDLNLSAPWTGNVPYGGQNSVGNGRYTLSVRGGTSASVTQQFLDMGAHIFDSWVAFSINVDFQTGNITASVNGTQVVNVTNQVILYNIAGVIQPHYWRTGCYRNPAPFTTTFFRTPLIISETSGT